MERLFLVGPGRFSLALGQAIRSVDGAERIVVCGRHPEPPAHPLFRDGRVEYLYGLRRPAPDTTAVFIGVPDVDLAEMAWALAGQGAPGGPVPVFHASPSMSAEVLAPLHGQGYTVGTFHPLVTLDTSFSAFERLLGAPVFLSGERGAAAAGRRITQMLGGRILELPATRRASASAAEAIVREGALAILELGRRVFGQAGLDGDESELAVRSLVRSLTPVDRDPGHIAPVDPSTSEFPAVDPTAIVRQGVDPDAEEIDLHLRALPPEWAELYRTLIGIRGTLEIER